MKKPGIQIIGKWLDELDWCPSQCYLNIKYLDKKYVIYLRWRNEDPWSATLYECSNKWDIRKCQINKFDLEIPAYKDSQLSLLKKFIVKFVSEWLYAGGTSNRKKRKNQQYITLEYRLKKQLKQMTDFHKYAWAGRLLTFYEIGLLPEYEFKELMNMLNMNKRLVASIKAGFLNL